MIQLALARLMDGRDLTRSEARAVMDQIMSGDATAAQIGAFLVALRIKGETPDEIAGCAEAMRAHVLAVQPKRTDLVDTAGTGGDGARTFNISTAAALVAAAAGAGVAKHGNRAVSSASGSADVLEALGFELELPPERIEESIDELGFGFLFAPFHHPAMRHAAPVRRELATRTVFNVLGPLTNPAGARAQVVGVYAPELVPTIARGARPARRRARLRRPRCRRHRRAVSDRPEPRRRGGGRSGASSARSTRSSSASRAARRPSSPVTRPTPNAATIRRIFAGETGPRRDAVVLNAPAAIVAAGHADDLRDGIALAAEAIDSGSPAKRLEGSSLLAEARRMQSRPPQAATRGMTDGTLP